MPGGSPPLHRHDFEATFMILDGESEFVCRGATITARADTTVNIPASAPHNFRNRSGRAARMLCMCTPAAQDEYFEWRGDTVPDRTTLPPKLSKDDIAERQCRATELAPRDTRQRQISESRISTEKGCCSICPPRTPDHLRCAETGPAVTSCGVTMHAIRLHLGMRDLPVSIPCLGQGMDALAEHTQIQLGPLGEESARRFIEPLKEALDGKVGLDLRALQGHQWPGTDRPIRLSRRMDRVSGPSSSAGSAAVEVEAVLLAKIVLLRSDADAERTSTASSADP